VCGDNNYTSRCHAIKTLFVQNHGTELKRKWWRTYWLHASVVVVLRRGKKFKKYILAGTAPHRPFALHPSLRIGRTPSRVKFNTTRAVTWLADTPTFMIVTIDSRDLNKTLPPHIKRHSGSSFALPFIENHQHHTTATLKDWEIRKELRKIAENYVNCFFGGAGDRKECENLPKCWQDSPAGSNCCRQREKCQTMWQKHMSPLSAVNQRDNPFTGIPIIRGSLCGVAFSMVRGLCLRENKYLVLGFFLLF